MNQSSATKLISKLRYKFRERRKLSNPDGPQGRHNKIRKTVTALFKHERLELNYNLADESRGYAERLISDAIRYGDRHRETMEMATYWITEPPVVHKLFKVLAPRYQNHRYTYTNMWRAPTVYPGRGTPKCVLELQGNIYPSLAPNKEYNKNLIHNVLLEEARKEYIRQKEEQAAAAKSGSVDTKNVQEDAEIKEATGEKDANVHSDKMRMTDGENELPHEENLKAEGDSKSESLEKSEAKTSEIDVDLNKIDIKEKGAESHEETEKK